MDKERSEKLHIPKADGAAFLDYCLTEQLLWLMYRMEVVYKRKDVADVFKVLEKITPGYMDHFKDFFERKNIPDTIPASYLEGLSARILCASVSTLRDWLKEVNIKAEFQARGKEMEITTAEWEVEINNFLDELIAKQGPSEIN